MRLPGIGEALAQRIIGERPYASVETSGASRESARRRSSRCETWSDPDAKKPARVADP